MDDQWMPLVRSTVGGDPEGTEALALAVRDRLLAFFRARPDGVVRAKEEVEDLASETMLRVLQNIDRFEDRDAGGFQAWVDTIARNVLADVRKGLLRDKRDVRRERPLPSGSAALQGAKGVGIRTATSPSMHAVRDEELRRLEEVKALLSAEDRRVLDLKANDLSWAEVGRLLGVSEEAARKRWVRASERLTERYLEVARPHGPATPA